MESGTENNEMSGNNGILSVRELSNLQFKTRSNISLLPVTEFVEFKAKQNASGIDDLDDGTSIRDVDGLVNILGKSKAQKEDSHALTMRKATPNIKNISDAVSSLERSQAESIKKARNMSWFEKFSRYCCAKNKLQTRNFY